ARRRGHVSDTVPGTTTGTTRALRATMTTTIPLTDADSGATTVLVVHNGIPDAIPAADNEIGTRMALANSPNSSKRPAASLTEPRRGGPPPPFPAAVWPGDRAAASARGR